MPLLVQFLNALVKLPGAVLAVEKVCQVIVLWYVSRQGKETLKGLANAAAIAAKCKTQEERHAALDSWTTALNRPRYRS